MTEYVQPLGAAIALIGLVYKLRELRRDPHNPALRAICGVLAALSVAVLLSWSPAYLTVDRLTGVPNLARLLLHSLALTAAASIQTLFLHLGDPRAAPRRSRIRWAILGAFLVMMAVAFWLAPLPVEAAKDFASVYADDPYIAWYMLFYLSFLALAMTDILRMSLRYARHAARRLLRLGIRLLAAGSVIGLLYVTHKGIFVAARLIGAAVPWSDPVASRLLVTSGVALVTAGLVLPSLGMAVIQVVRWPRRYRRYRRLYPLWLAVYEVAPEIALYPPAVPGRDRVVVRGLAHALYRRVIEIHDGILKVRPYSDLAAVAAARELAAAQGLPSPEVDAIAAATAVATGIRAKRVARASPAGPQPVPPVDNDADAAAENAEMAQAADPNATPASPDDAAAWLVRVAAEFAASPPYCRDRPDSHGRPPVKPWTPD